MSAVAAHRAVAPHAASAPRSSPPWASQIGITVAFLLLWAAVHRPRAEDVPVSADLPVVRADDAVLRDRRDAADDGHRRRRYRPLVPVDHGARAWSASCSPWQATGSVELGVLAALGVGALAGLFNGLFVTLIGIPALVVTIGTQFLFRGLTLVLVGGKSTALVDTQELARLRRDGRQAFGIPMEFYWFVLATVARWVLLNRHRLGQNAYVDRRQQPGGALMGIPIRRTRITAVRPRRRRGGVRGRPQQPAGRQLLPRHGRRLPPAGAGRGLRRRDLGVRRPRQRLGTFIGAFMIGGIQAGIVAVGLTDYYTSLVYGAVILISVSIHAVLQRRFE